MKLRLIPPARLEFDEALGFYASRASPIATNFIDAFEHAKRHLLAFPNAGSPHRSGCRRVLMSGFPYQIVYRVEGDLIVVYAFAHQKRRPGYWRNRLAR